MAMVVVVVACTWASVVTITEAKVIDHAVAVTVKPNALQAPQDICVGCALFVLYSKII